MNWLGLFLILASTAASVNSQSVSVYTVVDSTCSGASGSDQLVSVISLTQATQCITYNTGTSRSATVNCSSHQIQYMPAGCSVVSTAGLNSFTSGVCLNYIGADLLITCTASTSPPTPTPVIINLFTDNACTNNQGLSPYSLIPSVCTSATTAQFQDYINEYFILANTYTIDFFTNQDPSCAHVVFFTIETTSPGYPCVFFAGPNVYVHVSGLATPPPTTPAPTVATTIAPTTATASTQAPTTIAATTTPPATTAAPTTTTHAPTSATTAIATTSIAITSIATTSIATTSIATTSIATTAASTASASTTPIASTTPVASTTASTTAAATTDVPTTVSATTTVAVVANLTSSNGFWSFNDEATAITTVVVCGFFVFLMVGLCIWAVLLKQKMTKGVINETTKLI